MKARHQRLLLIVAALGALALIAALVFSALKENVAFFYSPSDIKANKAPQNKLFRVGGQVEVGSLKRQEDGVTVRFVVTDNIACVPVQYQGVLPDLFSEGKGAVVQGRLNDDGIFIAQEVIAKHDENYMPPEVAQAMQTAHAENAGNPQSQCQLPDAWTPDP
ncbi:MAG: cytochrome c maturation protein CcmE [Zoogloeaceae bacterium]|jgi:cytochrome c-type biogenesis protein CcmE|nr:cytochrome c maturation protein CcmE [Zoogloeaceae bacterium]